ncbi:MAG TPA: 2Fe-2S iron-sulfur cluster-binding protein [Candidatus Limnocylindrales bacterium]
MSAKKARPVEIEPTVEVDAAAAVELSLDPGPPPRPTRVLRISRRRSGDRKPHFDDFEIEVEPGDTVLDALLRIRRTKEPSLVVRHSCMHASCGTCGVRINGRESLACDTKVDSLPAKPAKTAKPAQPIKVESLANQRPVADLATDMVDFYARFEAAGLPLVRNADMASGVEPPDGIKAFGRFENCIECGLCLSACPIARTNHDYIGPAALAAAARIVEEPRGRQLGPVLALAAEPDSVWRCRAALECSVVCPSAVEPALALLTLRRHIAANRARRLFGRKS